MRRKLMALSALTCIAGGSVLLAPASAQGKYATCESLLGTRCTGSYTRCTGEGGEIEYLQCRGGTWQWS
ncbi:MAG: hypothetical protein AB1941_28535 [Gemmatimonadota bacterium]